MSLLLSMLPIYIFGNLHCIGMCGPLVLMLGRHRYRYFYFLGRTLSFTLAGMFAGGAGGVLHLVLKQYQIPALTSFLFGGVILIVGLFNLAGWRYPGQQWFAQKTSGLNHSLSLLMLRDQPLPSFLFGFFTIALPCGQTVIVYSACALSGDLVIGMVNGFAFALLTSPALFLAMNAHTLLQSMRRHYRTLIGVCALVVGGLALCRGLAELEIIPHLVLSERWHVVLY